jgi:hypothetical protein
MAIITGSDGAVKINLGDGLEYIAEVVSWTVNMDREMLSRTNAADESERTTGGRNSWTGDLELHVAFSDDTSVALSSWQLLAFAINNTDDDLKAELRLVLQRYGVMPDYTVFNTSVAGVVELVGTVVLGPVSLNCEDPEKPIVLVISWTADGPLALQRTAL